MNAHLVIDLMNGDGGKGITTDRLASNLYKALVIRFNGGQNAGHTVVLEDGTRHVFANFGSGTLRGVPTYWSKYCTCHPNGFVKEYDMLVELGFTPELYMDNLAMITTPYDILYNQALEKSRQADGAHGSMGVGFGTTIERNQTPYKLHAQDILNPTVLKQKLASVFYYYDEKVINSKNPALEKYWNQWDFGTAKDWFIASVERIKQMATIHFVSETNFWGAGGSGIHRYENLIFEGSQGIMLDMDFGYFPNVSRSNCTSKNAMELLTKYFPLAEFDYNGIQNKVSVNYVTRAYQTRHGNGYMTNEEKELNVRKNPIETNTSGEWQGDFRRTQLDFDMLNYSLTADANFSGDIHIERNLVVICLDQVDGYIRATAKGKELEINPEHMEYFLSHLDTRFYRLVLSKSDCSDKMENYEVWNLDEGIEIRKNEHHRDFAKANQEA